MKKIITFVLAICFFVPCAFMFSGCGKDDGKAKVMNVSLNPSVEFVLSKDNKVVSVNATNDEGNFVIAKASFNGLTAEDAVDLFLKTVKENGFIPEATVGVSDEELIIEISGEDAQKLFDSVKSSALEYLDSIDLSVNITFDEKTKDELEALVGEAMQELSTIQINNMSEEELVSLIKQSREETKNLMSQELKDLYYQSRAEELVQAKIETVNTMIANILPTMKQQFMQAATNWQEAYNSFKSTFTTNFLDNASNYQQKMEDFIDAKKALLEARLSGEVSQTIENAVQQAESALTNAKGLANQAINSIMTTASQALDFAINTLSTLLNQDTINQAIEDAKASFKAEFATEYSSYINNNYWLNLAPATQE